MQREGETVPQKRVKTFLKSVSVEGLFGRFNYNVELSEPGGLSIVTAPNGYGKTALLTLIRDFFDKKFLALERVNFRRLTFFFSDGRLIQLERDPEPELPIGVPRSVVGGTRIAGKGFGADEEVWPIEFDLNDRSLREIERMLPITRHSSGEWYDYREETTDDLPTILDRYRESLPASYTKMQAVPAWLTEAGNLINCTLIETHRLLSMDMDPHRTGRAMPKPTPIVMKNAQDLSGRIGSSLQEYAKTSQTLDQTFPKRIIDVYHNTPREEKEIRDQLTDLNRKRDALVEAGLMAREHHPTISYVDKFSEPGLRNILNVYVSDTNQKLSTFDQMLTRVTLFRKIVNEHFKFKKIQIDSSKGMSAIESGTGKVIPLSSLSSGEQHILVLLYSLLFNIPENSLILIDEPELSLHVAWQTRFLSDIFEVQKIHPLSVVIATHSPQIIHDRLDIVQDLADMV